MYKKLLLIILPITLIFGLFLFFCSPIIFQEGGPWPQMKGIIQLNFTGKDMVKLSSGENKYMTKSKGGVEVIKSYMKGKEYEFIEQLGSGYIFESTIGEKIIVVRRHYSRFYSLWNITENNKMNNESEERIDIAKELKECLPKSDMDSHERCNELLAMIRNFDDCVKAGFEIMKSNPPQCTIPDGRIFADESNSTWDAALSALNNCEVKSIFQTHNKRVILKLKNGNEIIAYEPRIDDAMDAVGELDGKCGDIIMMTE